MRAKYTIYLPSFLAAIHYYVAFPLVDILFITKEIVTYSQSIDKNEIFLKDVSNNQNYKTVNNV
jgi:hypothetical protein